PASEWLHALKIKNAPGSCLRRMSSPPFRKPHAARRAAPGTQPPEVHPRSSGGSILPYSLSILLEICVIFQLPCAVYNFDHGHAELVHSRMIGGREGKYGQRTFVPLGVFDG